jgi:uncharacterized surface protein with fasciclin (FAS1) repeats
MNNFMNTKKYIALSLVVLSLFFFTKCAEEFEAPDTLSGSTLVEIAATDTTLEILTAALAKTGIGISLDNINSGVHTVFAPTDSAFRAYFQPIIGGGPGDDAIITYVDNLSSSTTPTLAAFTARLQYHIVSSEAMSATITSSQVFTTINAARLSLSKSAGNIYINGNSAANGAKFRTRDIDGANGVIHTINNFMTAISTASVVTNTLGITINYATAPPTVTVGATSGDNYDLFANAIKKTGLATTLRPNVGTAFLPDYTIFAPQDAFMKTYLETFSGPLADEAAAKTFINSLDETTTPTLEEFTDVIKYHIVTGRALSTDLTLNQNVTTLLTGKTFKVTAVPTIILEDATAAIANVTSANVLTNAGVLHRLDAVLKSE